MKKFLFWTAFFLFFPAFFASTEPSPAAQKILEYAEERIIFFQNRKTELEQDSELSKNFCYEKGGWMTEITFLGNLGGVQINRSKELLFGNVCLRDDVLQIENHIAQLAKIGTRTRLACSDADRKDLENSLEYIFFAKKYLLQFGLSDKETESSVATGNDFKNAFRQKFGIFPPAPLDQIDTFTAKKYRDAEYCKGNSKYFSFTQLKKQIQEISAKIKEIREAFSDMKTISDNYFAGKENTELTEGWANMVADAKKSSKISAERWFSRNIERPLSSVISIARSDADIRALTARRTWKLDSIRRRYAASYIPPPLSTSDAIEKEPETLKAYGLLENDKTDRNNTESFFNFINDISVDSQLLSPEISLQLESDALFLPVSIEKTNEHLDDTLDLLQEACRRHAPCEMPNL